jgi:beta-glucanase (GH16 family)
MKLLKTFFILLSLTSNLSCQKSSSTPIDTETHERPENKNIPDNYKLILKDDFTFFNTNNWSKGLTHDTNTSVKMIWNKTTGGKNLLNDNYAGYNKDENTYIKEGVLYLDNRKEIIHGTDPERIFQYSTGWMNSLQKINFNGTQKSIYLEIKAKFPIGDKVWPAIWLIDDSENRAWPPEVDIWEYFGKFFNAPKKDQMYMRFIYGKWNDKKDHSVPINNFHKIYNASNEWHVYGYQWTKDKMSWFIDGKEVHSKLKDVEVPASDWPDKKMCLVINNGLLDVVSEGNTIFPNSLALDSLLLFQED